MDKKREEDNNPGQSSVHYTSSLLYYKDLFMKRMRQHPKQALSQENATPPKSVAQWYLAIPAWIPPDGNYNLVRTNGIFQAHGVPYAFFSLHFRM